MSMVNLKIDILQDTNLEVKKMKDKLYTKDFKKSKELIDKKLEDLSLDAVKLELELRRSMIEFGHKLTADIFIKNVVTPIGVLGEKNEEILLSFTPTKKISSDGQEELIFNLAIVVSSSSSIKVINTASLDAGANKYYEDEIVEGFDDIKEEIRKILD